MCIKRTQKWADTSRGERTMRKTRINSIDIQMPQPFKSLFQDLFDLAKWQMPKKVIEMMNELS
jgi:hypothetical protein